MVDVTGALAIASAGRKVFTDLLGLAKKRGNAEVTEKIAEAQLNFLELVNAQSEGQEEIRKLREEVRQLKEQLRDKRKLVFRENCYWDQDTNEGPFCSACQDAKDRLIRMKVRAEGRYTCPVCKHVVVTDAARRRFDAVVRAHNESTGY